MKHFVLALMAAATLSTQAVAQNRVKNVYASSAKLNVEMLQQAQQAVQLNRYLFAGYNTICLPMSMTAEQLQAQGVTIERMVAVRQEGKVVSLYFVDCTSEGLEAGQPYLINSQKSQYLRVLNTEAMNQASEPQAVVMSDSQGNVVTFGSSWESMEKNGRYGIPAKQDVTPLQSILVRTEGDKTFLPTRCGFNWDMQSGTAETLEIKHLGSMAELQTTGINVAAKQVGTVDVYDLKGNVVRRGVSGSKALNGLQRGIYIVNGEKVTVQ